VPPILQIIAGTPVWVWVLLAFLSFLGVRALRPATAPLWRIAILPTIFFVWGLYNLVTLYGPTPQRALPWLAALACGTFIGMLVASRQPIRADKKLRLVRTSGGPLTLVLILLIFSIKYVFGFLHAMRPGAFADARFWLTELGVSGVLAGMFIGRFVGLWHQYRAAPHEDLGMRGVPA
jgi:hypothetical protein